jgi:hypothetical protein
MEKQLPVQTVVGEKTDFIYVDIKATRDGNSVMARDMNSGKLLFPHKNWVTKSNAPKVGEGWVVRVDDSSNRSTSISHIMPVYEPNLAQYVAPVKQEYTFIVKKHLGTSGNGVEVIDRVYSHNKVSTELLREAVAQVSIDLSKDMNQFEVDMGRIIGKSGRTSTVNTKASDIVYAIRKGRTGYSRFTVQEQGEPTNIVQFVTKTTDDGKSAVLINAYIGPKGEREPFDKHLTTNEELLQSLVFWSKNALVLEGQEIIEDTLTKDFPWQYLLEKLK